MSAADAEQALDRHATSKLRSFTTCSRSILRSAARRCPRFGGVAPELSTGRGAFRRLGLQLEGGKLLSKTFVGRPAGTTIDVQDCFLTPPPVPNSSNATAPNARTSSRRFKNWLWYIPLHIEVAFDGRTRFPCRPSELGGRLSDSGGITVSEKLLPVEFAAVRARFAASSIRFPRIIRPRLTKFCLSTTVRFNSAC